MSGQCMHSLILTLKERWKEINRIVSDAEERRYGDWRGQEYPVVFHIKGDDVVVESKDGEFITILKGGVSNARVKNPGK